MTNKQTCILVLGMHRSGTSALTGVLNLLDINLGNNLLEATKNNKKGHFENKNIYKFHDYELLPFLKSSWDDLSYLPKDWYNNKDLEPFYQKAKKIIFDEYAISNIFAIKDPRISFLFPFWEKVLSELSIEIKIIIAFRQPLEIAKSLYKRDNFSVQKSLILWSKYILYAEYYSREYKRVFIDYNSLLEETFLSLKKIKQELDCDFDIDLSKIDNFIEINLKHNNLENELILDMPKYITLTLDCVNTIVKSNDSQDIQKNLDKAFNSYKIYIELLTNLELDIVKNQQIKIEKLKMELNLIKKSRSWRITKPFRKIGKVIRELKD